MMNDPGYQLSSFVSPIGIRAWYTLVKVLQLLNELCVVIFQLLFQCINAWYLLGMYRDKLKGKEVKLFGYSVLDTVKLRNGFVPDPERLPDIMEKHFTEQMSDFVACTWSEDQGGDLDVEHSYILTRALTTLMGKQHDEALGLTLWLLSGNKSRLSL
jgi:hypothetical protein